MHNDELRLAIKIHEIYSLKTSWTQLTCQSHSPLLNQHHLRGTIYDTCTYFDWSVSSFYMQIWLFKNDMLNLQQTIHAKENEKNKMRKSFAQHKHTLIHTFIAALTFKNNGNLHSYFHSHEMLLAFSNPWTESHQWCFTTLIYIYSFKWQITTNFRYNLIKILGKSQIYTIVCIARWKIYLKQPKLGGQNWKICNP